ncbi:Zn-ribbon-containing, possible RNA-binding protein-like protein [Legionella taurinensis]|nr:Zn-ribbon-containing, possible RNA-binding protein-like protein [Legionella taurinensis]
MKLSELNDKLTLYLSPSLRAHCTVGSFNRGCLVLALTDPAFATPLRYELPALRDRLRKEAGFYQLLSIQIKMIVPQVKLSPDIQRKCRPLSDKARAAIQQAGETCPYPPLQEALYKLAQDNKA